MNKITGILLTSLLSMTICGCGNSNNKGSSSVVGDTDKTAEVTGNIGVAQNAALPNTYKVPGKEIYVNGPNYQEIEEGYTELFIVHDEKYCAFSSDRKSTADSLLEAHEIAFSKLQKNMANYSGGINSITIDSEEYKTIGSIDTYYFEGSINYGSNPIFDGYAVGYAFILDGIPCEIIGSVIDDEQSSVTIQEIKDNVDAMMQSVRTTK